VPSARRSSSALRGRCLAVVERDKSMMVDWTSRAVCMASSVARLMNSKCNDMEGTRRGLLELLPRHLPRGNEEDHEKLQSGRSVSWQRFEPGTLEPKSRTLPLGPRAYNLSKLINFVIRL
jgi:hypothetical protein